MDAVHRAVRGERPLSSDVAAAVGHEEALAQPEAPHLRLSTREFDVLRALVEGASVEEIPRRLHLSPKTVSNYQTLVRLGVATAVELLRYAREHGLT